MSALNTILPGFTPTPLQQAAIDRIRECQEQLAHSGIQLRSAMELEFMVLDHKGDFIPNAINLDAALKWLHAAPESLPHIQTIKTEGLMPGRFDMPQLTTQYEVTVDDSAGLGTGRLRPVEIAAVTQRLKTKTLPDLLKTVTCLNAASGDYIARGLAPSFEARPHAHAPKDSLNHNTETSALHVNVSLINSKGKNIFAQSADLMNHCADALLSLQNDAALALLPSQSSLTRIGANESAPHGLGVFTGKKFSGNTRTSVTIRGTPLDKGNPTPQNLRIENRLAGADADPFVALAFTMSAMLSAVQNHVHVLHLFNGGKELIVDPKHQATVKTYDLPGGHADLVAQMRASSSARYKLGDKFYAEILKAYSPEAGVAR